jgi:hypothetical protein
MSLRAEWSLLVPHPRNRRVCSLSWVVFTTLLQNLRERCLAFILQRFDEISRTPGFEEMGRTNVELGKHSNRGITIAGILTVCV